MPCNSHTRCCPTPLHFLVLLVLLVSEISTTIAPGTALVQTTQRHGGRGLKAKAGGPELLVTCNVKPGSATFWRRTDHTYRVASTGRSGRAEVRFVGLGDDGISVSVVIPVNWDPQALAKDGDATLKLSVLGVVINARGSYLLTKSSAAGPQVKALFPNIFPDPLLVNRDTYPSALVKFLSITLDGKLEFKLAPPTCPSAEFQLLPAANKDEARRCPEPQLQGGLSTVTPGRDRALYSTGPIGFIFNSVGYPQGSFTCRFWWHADHYLALAVKALADVDVVDEDMNSAKVSRVNQGNGFYFVLLATINDTQQVVPGNYSAVGGYHIFDISSALLHNETFAKVALDGVAIWSTSGVGMGEFQSLGTPTGISDNLRCTSLYLRLGTRSICPSYWKRAGPMKPSGKALPVPTSVHRVDLLRHANSSPYGPQATFTITVAADLTLTITASDSWNRPQWRQQYALVMVLTYQSTTITIVEPRTPTVPPSKQINFGTLPLATLKIPADYIYAEIAVTIPHAVLRSKRTEPAIKFRPSFHDEPCHKLLLRRLAGCPMLVNLRPQQRPADVFTHRVSHIAGRSKRSLYSFSFWWTDLHGPKLIARTTAKQGNPDMKFSSITLDVEDSWRVRTRLPSTYNATNNWWIWDFQPLVANATSRFPDAGYRSLQLRLGNATLEVGGTTPKVYQLPDVFLEYDYYPQLAADKSLNPPEQEVCSSFLMQLPCPRPRLPPTVVWAGTTATLDWSNNMVDWTLARLFVNEVAMNSGQADSGWLFYFAVHWRSDSVLWLITNFFPSRDMQNTQAYMGNIDKRVAAFSPSLQLRRHPENGSLPITIAGTLTSKGGSWHAVWEFPVAPTIRTSLGAASSKDALTVKLDLVAPGWTLYPPVFNCNNVFKLMGSASRPPKSPMPTPSTG